jgi:hypothetical protein
MLNLRSFRDFPEIFTQNLLKAVLRPPELEKFHAIPSPMDQRLWLLSQLTTKELVQRHCATRWGWTPKALDLTLKENPEGGYAIQFGEHIEGEIMQELHGATAYSDRYAATCIREVDSTMRFGLSLQRIVRRFPFIDEHAFSAHELAVIRACDITDADQMLTGHTTLKEAATRAVGGDSIRAEVTSLLAGGRADVLACGATGNPLGSPVLRARSWFFDHHSLAYVAAWADPMHAPDPLMKIEEDPVLPEARHLEATI